MDGAWSDSWDNVWFNSSVKRFTRVDPYEEEANDAVRMSNAVKVFLAFDAPFWPEGLFDVVCADCFLPELWILSYPPEKTTDGNNSSSAQFDPSVARRTKEVVTFFAAGHLADRLSAMSKDEVVEKALDQLDEMFGSDSDPKPSRGRLTGSHVAGMTHPVPL